MQQQRTCVVCGKPVVRDRFRIPPERTTCGIPCRNTLIAQTRTSWAQITGANNPNWNGGQMHSNGYVYLKRPDHPRANKQGYVKRANLVIEAHLGRVLGPHELVHHRNGNKQDDRIENLEVMSRSEHQRLHAPENNRRRWSHTS